MKSRTALAAGLVGVSLLAGCNNDRKTDSNNDTSSFEQTIAQQAGEIQGLKDGQSKLEAAAGSLGTTLTQGAAELEHAQTIITEMQAQLAAKPDGDPEAIKALQATLTQLQNDLAAKPAGDPKAVEALQDKIAQIQKDLAAKPAGDPETLKTLQTTVTQLQMDLTAKPSGDPAAVKALQDALAQVQKDLAAKPSGDPEAIKTIQATLTQLQKDLAAKPAGDPATLKNILARLTEIEMALRNPDQSDMALTQFVDPMNRAGASDRYRKHGRPAWRVHNAFGKCSIRNDCLGSRHPGSSRNMEPARLSLPPSIDQQLQPDTSQRRRLSFRRRDSNHAADRRKRRYYSLQP